MRPHLSGASRPALHLVEDQQDAVRIAEIAQAAQAFDGQRATAAFALDGLDDDRGGRWPDGGFQRVVF
jgi:ParB family chromosome partitioning protein